MTESRAIADLVWAINSPSLVAASKVETDTLPRVDPNLIDDHQLLRFLDSNPTSRVGRYFESLVLYYLQHVLKYEIVACQQPIKVDGRTVGEIDFLYRDDAGLLTHLEVAVKFYLHLVDRPHNGSQFVGPNSSDTFERKAARMFDHQLPLSRDHRPNVDRRNAMVKGRIHYPVRYANANSLPERLAKDHLRGIWLRISESDQFETAPSCRFQVLQKPYWLTVDSREYGMEREEFFTVAVEHFANSQRPVHAAVIEGNGKASHIFIVPNHWPSDAKSLDQAWL